jgi:hypothetical protein
MKLPLPTLSLVLLTFAAAVDANARDNGAGAATGESWFGVDESAASTQAEVSSKQHATEPKSTAPELTTSTAQGSQTEATRSSGLDSRLPVSQSSPIRFEPDAPTVHLLVQNGALPYDSLVPYNAPGWLGWPPTYGYYREVGVAPIYASVCEGPCRKQIRHGSHQFALSKPGGAIVPVAGLRIISEPSLIQAHYVDRSDLRTAGVLIGIVGALGGLVMMAVSVHDEQQCSGDTCTTRPTVDGGWALAGLGVFAGSIVTSVLLLNQSDEAQLSISPLRLAPPEPRPEALHFSSRTLSIQGASTTIRF